MGSPTQRSLKHLRDQGYTAAIVERYLPIPGAPKRVDLWGMFDIEAISPPDDAGVRHILYVQTTSGSNVSSRLTKIRASSILPLLMEVPSVRAVVHGWRLNSKRRWVLREVPVIWPKTSQDSATGT